MSKGKRPKGRKPEALDHWPHLRQELTLLTAELERFPTPHDLERRGRYDIMRAIVRQGGSVAVARRLAEEVQAAIEDVHRGDTESAEDDAQETARE